MPVMGRAGRGSSSRRRLPVGKTIKIEPFNLQVGQKTVTIRTTDLTHIGYSVFADSPPDYPWYTGHVDNLAVGAGGVTNIPVHFRAARDRLKVFASAASPAGEAARDMTVQAESGYATPDPNALGPHAIVAKMGLGINQERYSAGPDGQCHAGVRETWYYQKYRDQGYRQVRFFIPVGSYDWHVNNLGYWDGGNAVNLWLDAVGASIGSGMPVTHLDCADVVGDWDMNNQGFRDWFDWYLGMVGDRIAARNFPKDRFIVGAINEYGNSGAGTNGYWQPHRFRTNQILRQRLPGHTLVEGPCNWKNHRALYDPGFVPWNGAQAVGAYVPWADPNTIQDLHHYEGWDLGGMAEYFGQRVLDWAADNNRAVYSGEWGFDSHDYKTGDHIVRWRDRFDAQSGQLAIARTRPTLWATTDGWDWRMTNGGGNDPRWEIANSIPWWAENIDKLLGHR